MERPLPPGSVIGILGGGQLGRMTAQAAADMGYRVHIYSADAGVPAICVAAEHTIAPYEDKTALERFAGAVDVITCEFENIPLITLEILGRRVPVAPRPGVWEIARHRLREKQRIRAFGIATTPFARVTSRETLSAALGEIGTPAILKTAEFGYDGKGQRRIESESDALAAWESLGEREALLEGWVHFERELSVIVARGWDGAMQAFPVAENTHRDHILSETRVPAGIAPERAAEAEAVACQLAEGLQVVGLLTVEFFDPPEGPLLVNEIAPRPHNSGHWSMDGCATSQFHQLVRMITGLPPGSAAVTAPTRMVNLIGDDVENAYAWLQDPHACLHLYGKKDVRPGRKMGHVNVLEV